MPVRIGIGKNKMAMSVIMLSKVLVSSGIGRIEHEHPRMVFPILAGRRTSIIRPKLCYVHAKELLNPSSLIAARSHSHVDLDLRRGRGLVGDR